MRVAARLIVASDSPFVSALGHGRLHETRRGGIPTSGSTPCWSGPHGAHHAQNAAGPAISALDRAGATAGAATRTCPPTPPACFRSPLAPTTAGGRPLSRPVAVVTGAGSGIGREVAHALLEYGYSVALAGRRAEALDETIADGKATPDAMLAVPTDVTDPAAVDTLFDRAIERFGGI